MFLTASGSASHQNFQLRAVPPRRRLAACAAARLTQTGNRVERAGQPVLGARASPVGAGAAWMSRQKLPGSPRSLREPPGRRAPSTCGDAEVRGVPFLVCCRRGGSLLTVAIKRSGLVFGKTEID